MHRDHKLALALALLLIGVAAALCFPRQRPADLADLELENADQLDAAIDLLPVRVYTESHTRPAEPGADVKVPAATNPELKDPFAEFALLAPAPDPIPLADVTRPANDRTAVSETASSRSVRVDVWPALDPPRAENTPIATHQTPGGAVNEPLIYEVRPGDTLSELAGRFLGSTRRYLDLYEANRDVLASPDDLRVGMRLRIPADTPIR